MGNMRTAPSTTGPRPGGVLPSRSQARSAGARPGPGRSNTVNPRDAAAEVAEKGDRPAATGDGKAPAESGSAKRGGVQFSVSTR